MTPVFTARFLSVMALAFVTACQPGQNPFQRNSGSPADTSVATATSVKLVDRDVEAPDVFQVADNALWDGRPSLGGVWVASPDAVDPERVIMRNPSNGKFVIGALFKRERDNPGPSLQISSDAAAALGMLAGQPVKISVTALRREEAPAAPVNAAQPILDAAETVQVEALAGEAPAPQPIASQPIAPQPIATQPSAPAASAPAATVPAAPAPTVTAPAASGPAASAPAAPIINAASGPFIQIGFFSIEANAKRAVSTLAAAGVTATMRSESSNGKTYWTVGARGDGSVLAKIKAAGFKDAYVTKG